MQNDKPQRMPNVPPFVKFVCANVPMVFDDSLSYYEALCALWKYIQGMTDVINNNATLEEEYIEKFNELKKFVDDYFDNLDVQEEINNKLDEMAEDGTLAEIIGNYLSEYVDYIAQGFIPNERSMDCNIIRYHKETSVKNIMVDCGTYNAWYYISQMLITEGISHLDYFILTHYHTDHDGNIQNLITNGYIDEDTVILVGCEYTDFSAEYNSRMIADLGYFTNAGLTYRTPSEGEVITIDNLKLTFHNCTKAVIDAYSTTNPNNGSLVFLAEFDGTKALYLGDALRPVYEYLDSINFPVSNVDLEKIGHHGIEQYTCEPFVKRLSPTYAIQTSGITDFQKNNFGICEEVALLKAMNTKIYSCCMQPSYIRLKASSNNISCISGNPLGFSDSLIERTYYVDANAGANAIQDGSAAHPFKEIQQALSVVEKTNGQNIVINVTAGSYGHSHESETRKNRIYINTGLSNRIEINGASDGDTFTGTIIVRNSNVYLKNIKIDTDLCNERPLIVNNSNLTIDGVRIESSTSTAYDSTALDISYNSNVECRGTLYISDVTDAIKITDSSKFSATANVTIGDITGSVLTKSTSSEAYFNDYLQFEDSTIGDAFTHYGYNSYSPINITGTHTNYATTVPLTRASNTFDWIEVFYRTNDGAYGNTGRIYSPKDKKVPIIVPNTNSGVTSCYNKQCRLNINTDDITIDRALQIGTKVSDGTVTVTVDNNHEYFDIVKVVGGFKDYAN